ncbi:hypothetical protein LY76DRAFT_306312 [Colletotrichum caudatum]|nr:hypothetical protein LY76DRAFT_306312 [Colletotrichum caudatum]
MTRVAGKTRNGSTMNWFSLAQQLICQIPGQTVRSHKESCCHEGSAENLVVFWNSPCCLLVVGGLVSGSAWCHSKDQSNTTCSFPGTKKPSSPPLLSYTYALVAHWCVVGIPTINLCFSRRRCILPCDRAQSAYPDRPPLHPHRPGPIRIFSPLGNTLILMNRL